MVKERDDAVFNESYFRNVVILQKEKVLSFDEV